MGVELKIRPAMMQLLRGQEPSADWDTPYVRRKAMSPAIREHGTLKCSSHNWPPMYAMVALGMHLVHGDDSFDWTVRWWRRYFEEALGGWWMHREFGSTIYRTWIRESVDGVRFVTRGRHGELHRLASDWLRAYWYLEFLAASPARPVSRYLNPGNRFVAPATNLCGGRSWSIKGDQPVHVDLHLSSAFAGHLRGRAVPQWVKDGEPWEIFSRCDWSGMKGDAVLAGLEQGREEAARKAVAHLTPFSSVVPGRAFRWADGSAAFVLETTRRLSGATAALAAMVTAGDGERRVLYHDSGARSSSQIHPADVEIEIDGSRVAATVEREGVRDLETRSREVDRIDRGVFEHPAVNRRRLVLHEGDSELLWHVKIDKTGTRIAGDPPPPPPPPPPPLTPDSLREKIAAARSAARNAGRMDDFHALAVTSLLARAVDEDLDPGSGEWEELLRRAENHARAWIR